MSEDKPTYTRAYDTERVEKENEMGETQGGGIR